MNVVIDCNVLFAAAWNDGLARRVLLESVRQCGIVLSPAMLAEYRRVAAYQKVPERREKHLELILLLAGIAIIVPDEPCPFTLPDPDDLPYLAAAYNGEADALVTGNLKHFPNRTYGRVRIASVRDLATELGVTG